MVGSLAREHKSNRYYKSFMAYDHLVTMLYQGFFQCLSLRELTTGLQANAERLKHLGLTRTPRRSTLADANVRRSAGFFEQLYHSIYKHYYTSLPDSRSTNRKFYIIDSTTISLFSNIMKGAGSYKRDGRKKGGAKAHVLMDAEHNIPCFVRITEARHHDLTFLKEVQVPSDSIVVFDKAYTSHAQFQRWQQQNIIWVTRQKNDSSYTVETDNVLTAEAIANGVIAEQIIVLGRPSNQNVTPLIKARRICYKDTITSKEFTFITNDISLQPQQIADIYKRRWQIELLFKRIKQRYPLRYFLGDSENAVRIQIWCMLICDLLIQIVMKTINQRRKTAWSYANLSSMIKHHLMTYIHLIRFLHNPEKALLNYKELMPQKGTLFNQGALF
jgi:transposase